MTDTPLLPPPALPPSAEPPPPPPPAPREPLLPRGALGDWWREGIRSALLMRADWTGLQATPAILACLFLLPLGLGVLFERAYIIGPAHFYWQTLFASGWVSQLLMLWTCWLVLRGNPPGHAPAGPAALFAMLCAQSLPMLVVLTLVLMPMARSGMYTDADSGSQLSQLAWYAGLGWIFLARALLMWRAGTRLGPRLAMLLLVAASLVCHYWLNNGSHWYPARSEAEDGDEAAPRFKLTQELVEQQSQLLQERLQALAPQRKGTVDVYALSFAPNADEMVFRRESAMVMGVMDQRFGSAGRSLQLVNHREDPAPLPWATPLNLQRAIQRMASLMDRDEDVLFLHLTSHGARDGQLAASFWPLEVPWLTPQQLRAWLDAAGVRHRVISVSACFSGSWIAPLADADTLVMTAADSEHTSYGCGRRSELTFFGRAMYDEALRSQTLSFEAAHAAARTVIAQREKEAGKDDGYSNPQIAMGERMRTKLAALERQLAR